MKNSIANITEEQAKELVGKFNKYRIGNMDKTLEEKVDAIADQLTVIIDLLKPTQDDLFSATIDRMNRQLESSKGSKNEDFKILENKYNYLLDVHQKLVNSLQKARIFAEKIIKRNNSKEHKEMEDLFAQMLEHIQKQKNKHK